MRTSFSIFISAIAVMAATSDARLSLRGENKDASDWDIPDLNPNDDNNCRVLFGCDLTECTEKCNCYLTLASVFGDKCNMPACTNHCNAVGGFSDQSACTNDCTCFAGHCDQSKCTTNCGCSGGFCDQSSCTENCDCAGGNCGPEAHLEIA